MIDAGYPDIDVPDDRCRISRSGSAKKAALALSAPLIAGDRYIN
jgi:hypothetical protein